MKKIYIISLVEHEKTVAFGALTQKLHMSWADGMIGACAAFANKKKAIKYCGNKDRVMEMIVEKKL